MSPRLLVISSQEFSMDNQIRNRFFIALRAADNYNQNFQLPPRMRIFIVMFVYVVVITVAIRIWTAIVSTGNLILLAFATIISFVLLLLVLFHCCFSNRGQGVAPIRHQREARELDDPEFAQMIHRAILDALNERNNGMATATATSQRTVATIEYTLDQLKNITYHLDHNHDSNDCAVGYHQVAREIDEEAQQQGSGGSSICTICLDEYRDGDRLIELRCGHVYHRSCLVDWLLRKNRCPLCSETVPLLNPSMPVAAASNNNNNNTNGDVNNANTVDGNMSSSNQNRNQPDESESGADVV